MRLPVITNSRRATFRRCAREHHLAYLLGYRSVVEADALRYGSLVHLGLDPWWRATDGNLSAAIEAMRGHAFDDFELVRAGVALQGYDARWSEDREHYEVLGVELEFRAPLINPETGAASRTYELAGKLDVLVCDRRDNRVYIVEHKTTSEDIGVGSVYWQRLTLNSQVSAYYAGAKALGYDVAGCIYDVLGKPQLRPSAVPLLDDSGSKIVLDRNGERVRTQRGKWRETADSSEGYVLQTRPETPDEFRTRLTEHIATNPNRYYQRGMVVRLEKEERDAAFDVWQTALSMRESERMGRAPRNSDACERFGRLCGFFEVCTGTASLEDPSKFVRVENVHPELSKEIQAA